MVSGESRPIAPSGRRTHEEHNAAAAPTTTTNDGGGGGGGRRGAGRRGGGDGGGGSGVGPSRAHEVNGSPPSKTESGTRASSPQPRGFTPPPQHLHFASPKSSSSLAIAAHRLCEMATATNCDGLEECAVLVGASKPFRSLGQPLVVAACGFDAGEVRRAAAAEFSR